MMESKIAFEFWILYRNIYLSRDRIFRFNMRFLIILCTFQESLLDQLIVKSKYVEKTQLLSRKTSLKVMTTNPCHRLQKPYINHQYQFQFTYFYVGRIRKQSKILGCFGMPHISTLKINLYAMFTQNTLIMDLYVCVVKNVSIEFIV